MTIKEKIEFVKKIIKGFKCEFCNKRIKEDEIYYNIEPNRRRRPDIIYGNISHHERCCRECYKKLYKNDKANKL